ncbi:hypothetical protein SeMB42_g04249 [Synchytrium endobioticum]|uniref:Phosphoacetylglucosamine mutase n=1 Tax=Synchytrium endobioticum TaxID=286115 RepID=A0A507CZZ5_9FUNG|nr:hypothetical protein SeLEV6574_g06697 [Synchytrium endobioticum]TPX44631.1 hypothetical protein SeMB42_g04249 [Synchytrium endobioticum]
MDTAHVLAAASKHPRPEVTFTYGTAGFRMHADKMDSIMFRVGLLAVLRSKSHHGRVIGVMVTASHNPEDDNGVKLVEPFGEMLAQDWEVYATQLANALTDDGLINAINGVISKESISMSADARVVIGHDTRPSCAALLASLQDGVEALGGGLIKAGLTTTPQLHYLTRCLNTAGTPDAYGDPTEAGYFAKLSDAYKRIVSKNPPQAPLTVDAANGVGAPMMKKLIVAIGSPYLRAEIINDAINVKGKLNFECGADLVKVNQRPPVGIDLVVGKRYCSLDGDADRLVYYYKSEDGKFRLLDGDKIAALAAAFIIDLVRKANVKITRNDGATSDVHVGLVQTAYANGSATAYIKSALNVPVVFTPTGVKHLHHEAKHFDVGVYFEANGHGTVLFSHDAICSFKSSKGDTAEAQDALVTLVALTDLINQTVGDALSDLLMVEAILACKNWSLADWDAGYTDLPSRQEKVKVSDRLAFVAVNADTELAKPEGLQAKINAQVSKFQNGRSFVRPSGTEDVVRVYAEADTQQNADLLANTICGIVFDLYGGVGDRPTKFVKAQ